MIMTPKNKNYENLATTVIKNMAKRQMEGYYAKDKKEALELLISMIPEGSSIGYGGSVSLSEAGVLQALDSPKYRLIKREEAKTAEDTERVFREILFADFFLMSSNAITVDAELVNVDGRGNRIAFLAYGPKNVILLCGMNKITADVDTAIKRIKALAAPMNAVRLNRSTPCAVTGVCGDCQSPDCICANTIITRRSHIKGRVKVILVGEELGF
jgi:L-lactate utilization protein LutB